MSRSLTAAFEACKVQRGSSYKNAQPPGENSLGSTRVPTFFRVPRILSSVPSTGVAFYKYAKLLHSLLRILHRVLQRHVPDQAGRRVVQGVTEKTVGPDKGAAAAMPTWGKIGSRCWR